MNTFEALTGRYSYRGIYQNAPVPREDLERIMQAGLDAPSGCNKQTTSLITVDDTEVLAKLQEIVPKGKNAPAMICVLTRKIIAYVDRIGDKMAVILGVPEDYELVAVLPVGIPAEETIRVAKKSFAERAWFNGFGK